MSVALNGFYCKHHRLHRRVIDAGGSPQRCGGATHDSHGLTRPINECVLAAQEVLGFKSTLTTKDELHIFNTYICKLCRPRMPCDFAWLTCYIDQIHTITSATCLVRKVTRVCWSVIWDLAAGSRQVQNHRPARFTLLVTFRYIYHRAQNASNIKNGLRRNIATKSFETTKKSQYSFDKLHNKK